VKVGLREKDMANLLIQKLTRLSWFVNYIIALSSSDTVAFRSIGQGEGLFRRLHVRWSFAFRVFFPASQPVESRHKRIGVPRMFFPARWLSAALGLHQSYREAPGRPSGGLARPARPSPVLPPVPVANRQH
jgi:hypothetical protein